MNEDCMLIYPYLEDANWKNELRSKDNLALGYLASCGRKEGYTIKIVHAEHHKYSVNDIINIVCECRPKSIGISCTAQRTYPVIKEYAKAIKKKFDIPIFMGGIFATVAYKEILCDCSEIDFISLGEGEKNFVDFLGCLRTNEDYRKLCGIAFRNNINGIIYNGPINVIENLDELPFPAKDFFDEMKDELRTGLYYFNISSGRGCFGNCSFCSVNKLTARNKRRVRTPDSVVKEIKYFQEKYGVNYFKFVDELFIDKTNYDWIYEFCSIVKTENIKFKFHAEARVDCIREDIIRKLKQAGLEELFIGFESGNEEVLSRYRKGHSIAEAEKAIEIVRCCPAN